jgi:2,4-dienoyl-CoA reductase-like NADH-dependent reductase (Old Yellow Enzyme family)
MRKNYISGDSKNKVLTRREFLKYSSLSAAGLYTMSNLTGCSAFKSKPYIPDSTACLHLDNIPAASTFTSNQIFESTVLNGVKMNNRIFRSGTVLGLGDRDGRPTSESIAKHVALAKGGAGAIFTEGIAVQKNGVHIGLNPLVYDNESCIKDYEKLTRAVHQYNTPIFMQVFHAGRQTRSAVTGESTIAPSAIRDGFYDEDTPKAITDSQIEAIIEKFVFAIEGAQKSGFDGAQLMAGHGYLLSDFLSPNANRRKDRWGGSTENRFRIIRKIYEKARKRVGHYPILIKMNAYDHQPDGMRVDESIKIAKLLENSGCDAIEVSNGVMEDGFSTIRVPELLTEPIEQYSFKLKGKSYLARKFVAAILPMLVDLHMPLYNYNVCAAKDIKNSVGIPVIVVGGIRDFTAINQIVRSNIADYVAMSRPFLIEPDIVNSFKAQQVASSGCVSCGLCMLCLEELPVGCHYI